MHDVGKCKAEFIEYITEGKGHRGSVNHTFAGCRMLLERFHGAGRTGGEYDDFAAELLAYAVGAHHGLFDCVDPRQVSGFLHRLEKEGIGYEESRDGFLTHCAGWEEIDRLFAEASAEIGHAYEVLFALSEENRDDDRAELAFQFGLLARLLTSAVVEGDRRDTGEFMEGLPTSPEPEDLPRFWDSLLRRVEAKLDALLADTPVRRARREISRRCRLAAERPGGIYRLYVPTGGGKTLTSLRYALAHASKWGKRRIVFTTPLLAILEQNASVIREYLDNDAIITEHHSNIVCPDSDNKDELDPRELAMENWHAPVIITTLVQLLHTMFLGDMASVRRFHSLCDAVVVIDEVQTVPTNMLSLFNQALSFLSSICGTTFLLCSATQPALSKAHHPLIRQPEDAVPYDPELWSVFRRTAITDAGSRRLDEIPDLVRQVLTEADSLLVVCNKKSEAEQLYHALTGAAEHCFHLSAAMCTAHRRDVLEQLRQTLEHPNGKVLCVATQVIEAGVDISFQRVIRLAAGMDNIVQAAGRCNRSGDDPTPAPVYVVRCMDENLNNLREIRRARTATLSLMEAFRQRPDQFQGDLASDAAIDWYYRKFLDDMAQGEQDFPLGGAYAQHTLLSLMGLNDRYAELCPASARYTLTAALRTGGGLFQVFDQNIVDTVVPYGGGEELIGQLSALSHLTIPQLRKWSRQAKPYTIALYDYQVKLLGPSLQSKNGVLVLGPEAYDPQTGLKLKQELDFLEV